MTERERDREMDRERKEHVRDRERQRERRRGSQTERERERVGLEEGAREKASERESPRVREGDSRCVYLREDFKAQAGRAASVWVIIWQKWITLRLECSAWFSSVALHALSLSLSHSFCLSFTQSLFDFQMVPSSSDCNSKSLPLFPQMCVLSLLTR